MTIPRIESTKLFTPDQCEKIIKGIERSYDLTTDWRTTKAPGRIGCRTSLFDFLASDSGVQQYIDQVRGFMSAFSRYPLNHIEPVEMVRYETGSSYRLHSDQLWRTHTGLVYLNDDYKGGNTVFPRHPALRRGQGVLQPAAGHIVCWNNSDGLKQYEETMHKVEKITEGVKYVLVCWTSCVPYVESDKPSGTRPENF